MSFKFFAAVKFQVFKNANSKTTAIFKYLDELKKVNAHDRQIISPPFKQFHGLTSAWYTFICYFYFAISLILQEDTMHRNLTVHEVLYYQAMLRLPGGTDTGKIKEKIRQVRHW